MRSPMMKRGFTLIELLVVIAIIAILASILFPVFAKAREKARQTTCTSQVRQLATAIQMYVQDNNSRYPGVVVNTAAVPYTFTSSWSAAIDNYVGSAKMYFCPSDAANDKTPPISYGYSGLLVRPDGSGLNEAQVKAPTEVGAIADATPSRVWADGGGLIGGGALLSINNPGSVQLDPTRHTGVIVGFCDGHAKYFPGKQPNLKQIDNPLSRAFYQAVGLGLVQNYGGGIELQVPQTYAPGTNVSIGGDYAAMPILMACAEIWSAKGGTWYGRGFKGSNDLNEKARVVSSTNYAWANASGDGAGTVIGYDALAVIVSQNCKIDGLTGGGFDATTAMTTVNISKPFQQGATGTPGYSMATGAHWQAYTYTGTAGAAPKEYNGNTLYFNRFVLDRAVSLTIGAFAIRVQDDADMVDKVSADPYGIGFCSTAMADTSKVKILDIVRGDGTTGYFPNANSKYRWVVPDDISGCNYPTVRALRAITGGTGAGALNQFINPVSWVSFKDGPLYKASYWVN